MKDEKGRTIYYLVYATKHEKGMEVMKEAMWKVDPTGIYRFSDRTNPRQKLLPDYSNEVGWAEAASHDVHTRFKGETVPLRDIKKFAILETPWLFKKGPILRRLEEKGRITDVKSRSRRFTYPNGCEITFSIGGWTKQIENEDGTITRIVEAPFGNTDIKVRFPCLKCGTMVESSEDITLEEPDYSADTAADSIVWSENGIGICGKCKKENEIEVQNSMRGMLIEIDGIKVRDIEYLVTKRIEEP